MDGAQQEQQKQRRRYQVGGSVPRDREYVYVERRADAELLALCRNGEYGYVLGSRQIGKSSLMTRAAVLLHPEGIVTVHVILAKLVSGGQRQGAEWMDGVVTELARELGLQGELARWSADEAALSGSGLREVAAIDRFVGFFRNVALPALGDQSLVVFFDEVDSVLRIPSTDAFFRAIRILHERRTHRTEGPTLRRLSIVLAGVAAPHELVRDKRRMPFNIGRPVEITPFGRREVGELIDWWAPAAVHGELAEEILHWTGGYAGLTVALCDLIHRRPPSSWTRLGVRALVRAELDKGGSIFSQPVRTVFNQTVASPRCVSLLSIYRKVLEGKTVQDAPDSLDVSLLKVYGLCRGVDGKLLVSNEITRSELDLEAVDLAIRGARAWQRWLTRASDPRFVARWGVGLVGVVLVLMATTFGLAYLVFDARTREAQEEQRQREDERERERLANKAAADQAEKNEALAVADKKTAEALANKALAGKKTSEALAAKKTAEALAAKKTAEALAAKKTMEALVAKKAAEAADTERELATARTELKLKEALNAKQKFEDEIEEEKRRDEEELHDRRLKWANFKTRSAMRVADAERQAREELLAGSWTRGADVVGVVQGERKNHERSALVAEETRDQICTYWSLFWAAPSTDAIDSDASLELDGYDRYDRKAEIVQAHADCWANIDASWMSRLNKNEQTFADYLDKTVTSEALATLGYSLAFSFPAAQRPSTPATDLYMSPTSSLAVMQYVGRLEILRDKGNCNYESLAIQNDITTAKVVFTNRMQQGSATKATPHEGVVALADAWSEREHRVSYFDHESNAFRPIEGTYEAITSFGYDYPEAVALAGRSGTWILDWDAVDPSSATPPTPTQIGEGSEDPVEVITAGTVTPHESAESQPAVAVGRQLSPWRLTNSYEVDVLWARTDAPEGATPRICTVRGEGQLRALSFSTPPSGQGSRYLVAATSRGIQMWEIWPSAPRKGPCRKVFVDPTATTPDEDKKLRASARLDAVVYYEPDGTLAGSTGKRLKLWKIEDLTIADPTKRERPLQLPLKTFALRRLAYEAGADTFYVVSNGPLKIRRHYSASVVGAAYAALRAKPQCELAERLRDDASTGRRTEP